MELNFLHLNRKKTEVMVCVKIDMLTECSSATSPLNSFSCTAVGNLWVLNLNKQVSAVVQSSFYHLTLISKTKPCLPHSAPLERVNHFFITSSLEYYRDAPIPILVLVSGPIPCVCL
ncbi:hypothetical protein ATANTOWER_017933 [Ataeniobius toweri]|uniref:Uncharacterized protein n=1 Tax=Ataeniobius toweri TaxID=208326 RepID=A0ABU7C2A3_9TELE|nr:hypothetical protein [Ataeniobius toweri]